MVGRILLAAVLLGTGSLARSAEASAIESQVQEVFSGLKALKPMQPRTRYTLRAHGAEFTGYNDDFLRIRTADEVKESGLSCGCGDYALVFLTQMKAHGFEVLLVDGAEISSRSLANGNAGHAIVAIRERTAPEAPWWLVDSTNLKILSRAWSPKSQSFEAAGFVYWIGYCGAPEAYPVHDGNELKKFYVAALASVPAEFFNRTLYQFKFTIDPSLSDANGNCLNPHASDLQQRHDQFLAQRHITPERTVTITLVRGGNDAASNLEFVATQGWVSHLGLSSGCSPGFVSYCERIVRSHVGSTAN